MEQEEEKAQTVKWAKALWQWGSVCEICQHKDSTQGNEEKHKIVAQVPPGVRD